MKGNFKLFRKGWDKGELVDFCDVISFQGETRERYIIEGVIRFRVFIKGVVDKLTGIIYIYIYLRVGSKFN